MEDEESKCVRERRRRRRRREKEGGRRDGSLCKLCVEEYTPQLHVFA